MTPDCMYKYFCASPSTSRNSTVGLPQDHEGNKVFVRVKVKNHLTELKPVFFSMAEGMYTIEPHDSISYSSRNDDF